MKPTQQLFDLLGGREVAELDFLAVVNEANARLVTPRLFTVLQSTGRIDDAPADIVDFLEDVFRRNTERNRRLLVNLQAAVVALNAAEITPVLLKGAVQLAGRGGNCDRILSDIDLLICPDEVEIGLAAMAAAGITQVSRYPGERVHVVAEFGDDNSVGLIDLHQRPAGPPGFAEAETLAKSSRPSIGIKGSALTPSLAHQILLLVMHDHFHDGGYWRGEVDLRHLLDMKDAVEVGAPFDTQIVENLCQSALMRDAVVLFLTAGREWLGANVQLRRTSLTDWLNLGRADLHSRSGLLSQGLSLAWPALQFTRVHSHRRAVKRASLRIGLGQEPLRVADRLKRMRQIYAPNG